MYRYANSLGGSVGEVVLARGVFAVWAAAAIGYNNLNQ